MNSKTNYHNRLLIIISSPSGTGKTSICKKILTLDKKIKLSVSHTTRAPRDNEVDGEDYFFISSEKFKNKIESNSFLEYAKVFDNYYGTSKKNVEIMLSKDFDVLFDIDWQGASKISNTKLAKLVTIFLVPPSKEVVFERLKKRSKETGDDIEAIKNRMLEYDNEILHSNEYDYIVVNDNFEKCIKKLMEIIKKERKLIT